MDTTIRNMFAYDDRVDARNGQAMAKYRRVFVHLRVHSICKMERFSSDQ